MGKSIKETLTELTDKTKVKSEALGSFMDDLMGSDIAEVLQERAEKDEAKTDEILRRLKILKDSLAYVDAHLDRIEKKLADVDKGSAAGS